MKFPGDTNFHEFWWKKRKRETDPLAAFRAHVRSTMAPLPKVQLPHLNLVTEPWDRSLERLDHNQAAGSSHQQMMSPVHEPVKPIDTFHERFTEPFRDPFSTIPGGFGPMGPGR